MMTCPRCGTACTDADRFCPNCGFPPPNSADYHRQSSQKPPHEHPFYEQGPYQGPTVQDGYRHPPRSIALAIIFSIITCGIYDIYWMVVLNDEINQLSGDTAAPSGIVVFLLSLVTCGIYGLYWAYVMGRKTAYLNHTTDSGIINLLIALFGFQIINLALFQDTVNHYAA